MSKNPFRILILCTGNSARSILAEAILNRLSEGRFLAYSAGSIPKGVPNPAGIALLQELGYETAAFRSKSWNEFAGADAPKMDLVITVCDSAAGETCPLWPGAPLKAHWGIPDPADLGETPQERRTAFQLAYDRLFMRASAFAALPIETMPVEALRLSLAKIARLDGATDLALQA
jgi:protein-tyrosine-phosphatase